MDSPSDKTGLPRKRESGAFTLIELLVVVAIIALLVSIVVPATGQVRAIARRSMCASQMDAYGVAVQNFVIEYKTYPRSGCGWDAGWPTLYGVLEMMGAPGSHKTHGLVSYENLLPNEIWNRALCPAMDAPSIWRKFANTGGAHPQCKVDFHPAAIGYQWNTTLRAAEGDRYPASLLDGSLAWWDATLWIWYIIHVKDNTGCLTQAIHPQEVGNPADVAQAWDGMDLGTVPIQTYWNDWDYEGLMAGWHVGPQTYYTSGWACLPADRHPGGSPNILYADGSVRNDVTHRLTADDIPLIAAKAGGGVMHLITWDDYDYSPMSRLGNLAHVVPNPKFLTRWP